MENRPLISVSMPAFNAARYIDESIKSVLSQTYENFELIIYDDGSTDKTREILLGYADPRIKIILGDVNKGLIFARNTIAREAKGKYLALLDADDIASPDRFEKQVAFLESGNADLCGSAYVTKNEHTGVIKKSKQKYTNPDLKALLLITSPFCNPTVMGRLEIFQEFPYLDSNKHAEDYGFFVEAALSGYKFANLPERLLIYRLHDEQISVLKMESAGKIFQKMQSHYLSGLGISLHYLPRKVPWTSRLGVATKLLYLLNLKIPGISFNVNCQIYSRFQYRGNGIWTPFTRLERFLIAAFASLRGRI